MLHIHSPAILSSLGRVIELCGSLNGALAARLTGARVQSKTGHQSPTRRARRAIYGAHPVACGRRDVRMRGAGPLEKLPAYEHPVHVTPPVSFIVERRLIALAIFPSAHVVQAVGPVMRFPWELVRSDQTRPGFLLCSARVQFRQEPRRRFCHRFHVKSLPVSLASFDGQMNTKGFPHEAKSEARPGKFTARSGNA